MTIAQVRILRLAAGTALSMWVSQVVGWQGSFIAPALTCVVLALPLPALKLKAGIAFCLVLTVSVHLSLWLLPWLFAYPLAGILLLALALFWTFYFTASGGNMVIGLLATAGIAISTAVGSVSLDGAMQLAAAFSINATIGIVFVWIAHGLIPDSLAVDLPSAAAAPPAQPKPDPADARWRAVRSLVIVFPIALWFMFSSASAGYIPVMIKVAAMGQEATNEATGKLGHSLVMSTIIGGIGAIIGWQALSIAPVLSLYVLLIGLAGLVMGKHVFRGLGLAADGATWSYGYLTMIVILAPAVTDNLYGSSASVSFWKRLLLFLFATAYAYVAVHVVSAFKPRGAGRTPDAETA